jgi:hypothetical protein
LPGAPFPSPLLFLREARFFTGELFFDLFGLLPIARGQQVVELFLQKDLPLGGLALINAVDLGEPRLLFGRERGSGVGV